MKWDERLADGAITPILYVEQNYGKKYVIVFDGHEGIATSNTIIAEMDKTQCSMQHLFESQSELWSRKQLSNHWSGKVIMLDPN